MQAKDGGSEFALVGMTITRFGAPEKGSSSWYSDAYVSNDKLRSLAHENKGAPNKLYAEWYDSLIFV